MYDLFKSSFLCIRIFVFVILRGKTCSLKRQCTQKICTHLLKNMFIKECTQKICTHLLENMFVKESVSTDNLHTELKNVLCRVAWIFRKSVKPLLFYVKEIRRGYIIQREVPLNVA